MKFRYTLPILATAAILTAPVLTIATPTDLVILHTNDTHSQIDPEDSGLGGILRRKVLIDSVRAANPNTLLVDVGDVVQGTLYFTLYRGEVENRLMDSLGYDLRILGNHEFDNGAEELAQKIANTKSTWLATNYDMRGTELGKKFAPYAIREIDGKKVGFIGLNLDPKGMISEGNYNGVKYLDLYKAANSTAWHLKHNEGVDYVIALSHIGYAPSGTGTSDLELAGKSEDIDIIIGGHSHTLVDPSAAGDKALPYRIPNANGDTILVVQTGKAGRYLGEVTLDLDNGKTDYQLIKVDSRLDNRTSPELAAVIEPYRQGVDSLMNVPVARTSRALSNAEPALLNFVADYIKTRGDELADGVAFAITNKGGIRRGLPKGTVTEGMVVNMLPFNNKVEVIELKGQDLLDNFDVMANTGGNGLSAEVEAIYDPDTKKATSVLVGGKPIDPDATYRIATIDYLANGGDYMAPLARGKKIAASKDKLSVDFLRWLKKNKKINPSDKNRMHTK